MFRLGVVALVLAFAATTTLAFVVPADSVFVQPANKAYNETVCGPQPDDNCGLIMKKRQFRWVQRESALCQVCVDLLTFAQEYVDCDEETVDEKLNCYCKEQYGSNGVIQNLCLGLIKAAFNYIETETDSLSPANACTGLVKSQCDPLFNFVRVAV